jgi:hypothetical protein
VASCRLRDSSLRTYLSPVLTLILGLLTSFLYLFLHLKTSYRLDNAKRDKLHGKVSLDEKVDTSELADKVRILLLSGISTHTYMPFRHRISDMYLNGEANRVDRRTKRGCSVLKLK